MTEYVEDPDERRSFDDRVKRLYKGNALFAISTTLELYATASPQQGSYSQSLQVMANECHKAGLAIGRAERLLKERIEQHTTARNKYLKRSKRWLQHDDIVIVLSSILDKLES